MTNQQTPLPNLATQLMLTLGCWLTSPFALQCAKSGLPPLKQPNSPLLQNAAALQSALGQALASEAKNRANSLISGLLRYTETPYQRRVTPPPCVWSKGAARLLDYGSRSAASSLAPVVLFIPSLINRYYILDLEEERSMVRWMATQGIHPMVLDWGSPSDAEKDYDCSDYITEILIPAIQFLNKASRQKVVLVGYCMGGVFSMGAARLKPELVSGLALLATPWDFYCQQFRPFIIDPQWHAALEAMLTAQPELPAEQVQMLFYLTDPWIFEQKFRRFATLQPDSRAARDFIALEHWVNDGIPMTAKVARECLVGWAQQNMLARGEWKVKGKRVTPAHLKMPCFFAIPRNDHVVPHDCATALADAMPEAIRIHPGAGHVGMIVGSRSRRELWQPLLEWALTLS